MCPLEPLCGYATIVTESIIEAVCHRVVITPLASVWVRVVGEDYHQTYLPKLIAGQVL